MVTHDSMNNKNTAIQILQTVDYPVLRDSMIEIYINSFTTGEYAQHIEVGEASSRIDSFMKVGHAIVAMMCDKLIGFAIYTSLQEDEEFPAEGLSQVDIDESLYIAEVLVDSNHRGKGVATMMINRILNSGSQIYSYAVIRVWQNNKPALLLYQKLGFKSIASISQTKFASKEETFEMRKVYLAKQL